MIVIGDDARREAKRERKRAEARGIEKTRKYLGTAPLTLTPQSVYHFDRDDQLDQLVWARNNDPDLGFLTRLLMLCTLPRSNPGRRREYRRVNGPFSLYMQAGPDTTLPYGSVPRLLLAWVCTEAVRTQSRDLTLGASVAEFMRRIGLELDTGGPTGSRTRLRNQMMRLFRARVVLYYTDPRGGTIETSSEVTTRRELWWDERQPQQATLWESTIRLGEDFFNEIIAHPVPLDMHVLKVLSRSPLGLDLYMWLIYRAPSLQGPIRLTWRAIYQQFGVNPRADKRTVDAFRTDCLRELKKLKIAWPGLDYATPKGCLELRPSPPVIPRLPAAN